ncbi:MAG: hypothetical protein Q4G61_06570 [Tissierellia bacterium]|nr:hypothetical protein [Tissierellia bacterium]
MTNHDLRISSKRYLKGNWGTAIVLSIILVVLSGLVTSLVERVFGPSTQEIISPNNLENFQSADLLSLVNPRSTFLSMLLTTIFTGLFRVGYSWGYLDLVDETDEYGRGSLRFESLLSALNRDGLKTILVMIITTFLTTLGYILFIIPGIFLTILYMPIYYVRRDEPELSIGQTLSRSMNLMSGNKLQYIKLVLPYMLIFIGAILLPLGLVLIGLAGSEALLGPMLLLIFAVPIFLFFYAIYFSIKLEILNASFYRHVLVSYNPGENYQGEDIHYQGYE